jgi:hypothetical protein
MDKPDIHGTLLIVVGNPVLGVGVTFIPPPPLPLSPVVGRCSLRLRPLLMALSFEATGGVLIL